MSESHRHRSRSGLIILTVRRYEFSAVELSESFSVGPCACLRASWKREFDSRGQFQSNRIKRKPWCSFEKAGSVIHNWLAELSSASFTIWAASNRIGSGKPEIAHRHDSISITIWRKEA